MDKETQSGRPAENLIEELITDIVDQQWETIISDNDVILAMIEEFAEDLGIMTGPTSHEVEAYSELMEPGSPSLMARARLQAQHRADHAQLAGSRGRLRMTDRLPSGTRVQAVFPSGIKTGTVARPTSHTHESYTAVHWDDAEVNKVFRVPTARLRVLDIPNRRAIHVRPPSRAEVLIEIAETIGESYPLQAQWLRNIAKELTYSRSIHGSKPLPPDVIAGATSFDRREEGNGQE